MSSELIAWLMAFALTTIVEVPLYALGSGLESRRRAAGDALLAQLLTHPIAWSAVRGFGLPLWPVELGVFLAEAAVYRTLSGLSLGRAVLISFVLNLTTTVVGLTLPLTGIAP